MSNIDFSKDLRSKILKVEWLSRINMVKLNKITALKKYGKVIRKSSNDLNQTGISLGHTQI